MTASPPALAAVRHRKTRAWGTDRVTKPASHGPKGRLPLLGIEPNQRREDLRHHRGCAALAGKEERCHRCDTPGRTLPPP